jgi:hypothetical protein
MIKKHHRTAAAAGVLAGALMLTSCSSAGGGTAGGDSTGSSSSGPLRIDFANVTEASDLFHSVHTGLASAIAKSGSERTFRRRMTALSHCDHMDLYRYGCSAGFGCACIAP